MTNDLRLNAIEHVSWKLLYWSPVSSRRNPFDHSFNYNCFNFVIQEGGVGLKGPRHILLKDEGFNESGAVTQSSENEKTVDFPKTDGVIIFSSLLF